MIKPCCKSAEFLDLLVFVGALAQLVERDNGIVEVNGSTPLRSKPPGIL